MQWEQFVPKSEAQLGRLARLRQLCENQDQDLSKDVIQRPQDKATQAGTGRAVVASGSVAELYSRYYDADFFEEDALGAEVQRGPSAETAAGATAGATAAGACKHILHTAAGAVMLQPLQYSSTSTLLSALTCRPASSKRCSYAAACLLSASILSCAHKQAESIRTTAPAVCNTLLRTHSQRVEQLSSFDAQCAEFEQQVSRAVALLEAIRAAQEQVSAKTSSLHSTCERLLTEERDLQSRVELLREPLQYFNSLEELGVQLGMPLIGGTAAQSAHISGPKCCTLQRSTPLCSALVCRLMFVSDSENNVNSVDDALRTLSIVITIHPGSDAFEEALNRSAYTQLYCPSYLTACFGTDYHVAACSDNPVVLRYAPRHYCAHRIDECMAYLSSQPHFKDSQVYVVKFGQLQSRALALVKNQVIEYLDQATRVAGDKPVGDGRLEASLVYSKFRAISQKVAANVALIRRHRSARHMLSECAQAYFERRLMLLRPAVRLHLCVLASSSICLPMTSMRNYCTCFAVATTSDHLSAAQLTLLLPPLLYTK
eukprot:21231-Heterococcus_DN1.PRE.2